MVGAKRTPFGCWQGCLSSLEATDLGGIAIKAAVTEAGLDCNFVLCRVKLIRIRTFDSFQRVSYTRFLPRIVILISFTLSNTHGQCITQ